MQIQKPVNIASKPHAYLVTGDNITAVENTACLHIGVTPKAQSSSMWNGVGPRTLTDRRVQ